MIAFQDIVSGLDWLGIGRSRPVIAHASLSAFGEVEGGAQTVMQAILSVFETVVMPGFTYKTMLVPEEGPAGNALVYGSYSDSNQMAEFFRPDMAVDRLMGVIPEALRRHPGSRRSLHPILSFVGVNADRYLDCQTLASPLGPVKALVDAQGWVILLGVSHSVNTSIHYAESLAGRRQFLRWALTLDGVVECPGFPGCSDGFEALGSRLSSVTRQAHIGQALVQAVPLVDLVAIAAASVEADPLALLCDRPFCERCTAVRNQVLGRDG